LLENLNKGLIIRILGISVDYGVCARCGAEVVNSDGEAKGKLFEVKGKLFEDFTDDVIFYECNSCLKNDEYKRFFKNTWFNIVLCRRH